MEACLFRGGFGREAGDAAEEAGVAEPAACDHDAGGAGDIFKLERVVGGVDVAIDNDGDTVRELDAAASAVPSRCRGRDVEFTDGAEMDEEPIGAGCDKEWNQSFLFSGIFPAGSHFHAQGEEADPSADGGDDIGGEFGCFQDAAAGAAGSYSPAWAPAVEVDAGDAEVAETGGRLPRWVQARFP